MLISNGWTDDLFPPDEAIRFYNRTRAEHPGTPTSRCSSSTTATSAARTSTATPTFSTPSSTPGSTTTCTAVGAEPVPGRPDADPRPATRRTPATARSTSGHRPVPSPDLGARSRPARSASTSARRQTISPRRRLDARRRRPSTRSPAAAPARPPPAPTSPAPPATGCRRAPAGGYTLMGSPTVIAEIASPGPNSQLAARLLDVAPDGSETLVARGLYRPEVERDRRPARSSSCTPTAGGSPRATSPSSSCCRPTRPTAAPPTASCRSPSRTSSCACRWPSRRRPGHRCARPRRKIVPARLHARPRVLRARRPRRARRG